MFDFYFVFSAFCGTFAANEAYDMSTDIFAAAPARRLR